MRSVDSKGPMGRMGPARATGRPRSGELLKNGLFGVSKQALRWLSEWLAIRFCVVCWTLRNQDAASLLDTQGRAL